MKIFKQFWETYIGCSLECPTCNLESGISGSVREAFKPLHLRRIYICRNCGEKLIDLFYQKQKKLIKAGLV